MYLFSLFLIVALSGGAWADGLQAWSGHRARITQLLTKAEAARSGSSAERETAQNALVEALQTLDEELQSFSPEAQREILDYVILGAVTGISQTNWRTNKDPGRLALVLTDLRSAVAADARVVEFARRFPKSTTLGVLAVSLGGPMMLGEALIAMHELQAAMVLAAPASVLGLAAGLLLMHESQQTRRSVGSYLRRCERKLISESL